MRQTNNTIEWKFPTKEEQMLVVSQWQEGIGFAYLKNLRNFGFIFTIICMLIFVISLFSLPDSIGRVLAMLIGAGFFFLLFILMNQRVQRGYRILEELKAGKFYVTSATGLQCFVYRGNRNHVGTLSVELEDGQKLNNLCTPYKTAKRIKHKKGCSVLVVNVANENRLLGFDLFK